MAYELYKVKLKEDAYFNTWEDDQYKELTNELKEQIYSKYLVKCEVLARDEYRCQNIDKKIDKEGNTILGRCPYCNNEKFADDLTLHHIKWQKNDGKDSVRNGITLCLLSHQNFHKAKYAITFYDTKKLPAHIRGHTFKLDKPDRINWKSVKADMRDLRKKYKSEYGMVLTERQITLLMKWLLMSDEKF